MDSTTKISPLDYEYFSKAELLSLVPTNLRSRTSQLKKDEIIEALSKYGLTYSDLSIVSLVCLLKHYEIPYLEKDKVDAVNLLATNVKYMAPYGIDMPARDKALQDAAKDGALDVVRYLVSVKTNTKARNDALRVAAAHGHLEIVMYLDEHGGKGGRTDGLTNAAKGGHLDVVKYLVDSGCIADQRVLAEASGAGQLNIVKYLIGLEVKINSVIPGRRSDVVFEAVRNGQLEIIKYLHTNGADIKFWYIQAAAWHGYLEMVKFLVEGGLTDTETRSKALENATEQKHSQIVKYLTKYEISLTPIPPPIENPVFNKLGAYYDFKMAAAMKSMNLNKSTLSPSNAGKSSPFEPKTSSPPDTKTAPVKKPKRDPIPAGVRTTVWNTHVGEDKGTGQCFVGCKSTITQSNFECGHIVSVAKGGSTTIDNLRPICSKCNKSMGAQDMNEYMKQYGYTTQELVSKRTEHPAVMKDFLEFMLVGEKETFESYGAWCSNNLKKKLSKKMFNDLLGIYLTKE